MQRLKPYIYQKEHWPQFEWDAEVILDELAEVRNLQGKIAGKMETLGFQLKDEALLETLSLDVLKSSEIEGEHLDLNQVRSSIAVRLGMDISDFTVCRHKSEKRGKDIILF